MDAAMEFLSLTDQLKTAEANQQDNIHGGTRPEGKDTRGASSSILTNGSSEAEKSLDNQEDKDESRPEHLKNSEPNQIAGQQSRVQSMQTIRNTLSTALNNLVTIRTSLNAEVQAVKQGRRGCDIVIDGNNFRYAPYYQNEICAILDILPVLEEEMTQVTHHVEYLEKNEARERKQTLEIIKELTQLRMAAPKKKDGMRQQARMGQDETNQNTMPPPKPQQTGQRQLGDKKQAVACPIDDSSPSHPVVPSSMNNLSNTTLVTDQTKVPFPPIKTGQYFAAPFSPKQTLSPNAATFPQPQQIREQEKPAQIKTNTKGKTNCYNCNSASHWKKDCPYPKTKNCPSCTGTGIWSKHGNPVGCKICKGVGKLRVDPLTNKPVPEPQRPIEPRTSEPIQRPFHR